MELTVPIAFSLGIFSSAHCLGMCGGISNALALGSAGSGPRQDRLVQNLLMNLGRVCSYTLAGALVGSFGASAVWISGAGWGQRVLRLLASSVLIAIGLYIGGWFPQYQRLERLGAWLWSRLAPYAQRLLPVRNRWQAFGYGTLWGWLPCGLVYGTLLWAAGSGSALTGAMTMASFGLGTLPAVWASGLAGQLLAPLWRDPGTRRYAGLVLILLGLASGLLYGGLLGSDGHLHPGSR